MIDKMRRCKYNDHKKYANANKKRQEVKGVFYGEKRNCPVCGKQTTEEYCSECVNTVNKSVEWLEDELDTDWERVVDLLGYYYERTY